MKEILIQEYNNLSKLLIKPKPQSNFYHINFINGAKLEITGKIDKKYNIQFYNQDTSELLFESEITNNMWTKFNKTYYINYNIKVIELENNTVVFEHKFNAKDKRVYIHFASKALGDTIAWFPFAEEFRKKHQCELIVSTFHNDMFEENYPNIKFITPGEEQFDLYAMYEVGWHYNEDEKIDYNKNISDFRKHGLQRCSSEILGVNQSEIKPKLTFKNTGSTIEGKYVVIAPHGSAHAKYWNYKGGWQAVVDYLNSKGYKVVMITQELLGDKWHDSKLGGTLTGVIDKTGDYPLSERANDLLNAKAFIGIGSGLSWVAWALKTPVVMISGFSEAYSEFKDCERISSPKNKCSGCFNRVRLDAGDWEWCPDHKGTDRMFECTKSIKPDIVIAAINHQLEKSL
jgi:autotransporter strand-loop-strand O-heptosyltransferase